MERYCPVPFAAEILNPPLPVTASRLEVPEPLNVRVPATDGVPVKVKVFPPAFAMVKLLKAVFELPLITGEPVNSTVPLL